MNTKITLPPLTYTGWGSLRNIQLEVERLQAKRILIVTDPFLIELGYVSKITDLLDNLALDITVYSEILPEPPLAIGEQLVKFTRDFNSDLVIGIGGGSALDLAKLAAIMSTNNGKVEDYLNLTATKQISHKGIPSILIPTTSGTGSEVTNIVVLSLETTKDVIAHDYLLADVAIIDPELTLTLPPSITAATGVDALTHAIEAYVSKSANPLSDALAIYAIKVISGSIRQAVNDGQNKEARTNMSYGSYLAGLAFFNAGVAGVHALAYPLGGLYHLAHGDSNAVLLPYVMGYIRSSCKERMKHIYEAFGYSTEYLTDEDASKLCVNHLQNLIEELGIPTSLKGFNIPEHAIEGLTNDAVKQTRLLARSPMLLQAADIEKIYRSAYEGIIVENK